MRGADGRGGEGFEHEIPVRHAIERVGCRAIKPKRPRRLLAVDGEGGSGEGGGANRAFVEALARVGEPSAVAAQHFHVGEQMMAEGHRLGRLKVGEAGHDVAGVKRRLVDENRLEVAHLSVEVVDRVAHPEAEIERHLIVARPRGVQTPGFRPDDLGQPRLDIHMNVLERAREREGAALDFAADLV